DDRTGDRPAQRTAFGAGAVGGATGVKKCAEQQAGTGRHSSKNTIRIHGNRGDCSRPVSDALCSPAVSPNRAVTPSTRGPSQGPPSKQMDVQVGDGLTTIPAVVDDDPVTGFVYAKVSGEGGGGQQKVAEQSLLCGGGCADP